MASPSVTELGTAARLFGALSDETRLKIIDLLAAGERCVCELTEPLGVPQPLASFHLRSLREAGLVTSRREGRWVYYALDPGAMSELAKLTGWLGCRRASPSWSCC